MECPDVDELPAPRGSGWPWTVGSPRASRTGSGAPWPRISVVTVNYNHARFLEEAIRSVLLQGYPALEYFVIDGGSTDGSIDTIRRYERWLARWISEKDEGTADGLNKALDRVTGDIVGWISSTDRLLPGTLEHVAAAWITQGPRLFYGRCETISEGGDVLAEDVLRPPRSCTWKDLLRGVPFPLAAVFFPGRGVIDGMRLDRTMPVCTDWEFAVRVVDRYGAGYVDRQLASFRIHPNQLSEHRTEDELDDRVRALRRQLARPDLALSRRMEVIAALGRALLFKARFLRRRGARSRSLVVKVSAYVLDWREWPRRARLVPTYLRRGWQ